MERIPAPETKWLVLAVIGLLGALGWWQTNPPEADLPPCHLVLPISILGIYAVYLFGRDRRYRQRRQEEDSQQREGDNR